MQRRFTISLIILSISLAKEQKKIANYLGQLNQKNYQKQLMKQTI